MINCLPAPSRKFYDHSNINSEFGARCRQAVTALWTFCLEMKTLIALIDRVRMLDNDMIRLTQKLNMILDQRDKDKSKKD